MNKLEKQMKNLPKARLSRRRNLRLRWLIYKEMIKQYRARPFGQWELVWQHLVPAGVIIVVLALIVVIPGYSYASDQVTHGHWLYPVKESIEKVELGLADSEEEKTKVYNKLLDRRLAEAKVISHSLGDKDGALAATVNAAASLSAAADKSEQQAKQEVAAEAREVRARQADALIDIAQSVGVNAPGPTMDSIALALDKMKMKKPLRQMKPKEPKQLEEELTVENEAATTSEKVEKTETKASTTASAVETAATSSQGRSFGQAQKYQAEEARQTIEQLKGRINKLKQDFVTEEYDEDDAGTMVDRLNSKIDEAEDSAVRNNYNNLPDLFRVTEALSDNAKYFMKQAPGQLKKRKNKETGAGEPGSGVKSKKFDK